MAEYVLTNRAVKDLSEIWNYTLEHWSEQQADDYYWMLLSQCDRIASNPELGRSYQQVDSDLRGLKVNRHIIFYRRTKSAQVEITRILHERMDLRNRLKSD